MPLIKDWNISLEADQVLRQQGADPQAIRSRRPALVSTAEWALKEGLPLLEPAALFVELPVKALRHERVYLDFAGEDGKQGFLSGALLASHLGAAERIAIAVCTIGEILEMAADTVMEDDFLKGLALDAVGSAAAEVLGNALCAQLESQAQREGLQSTLPLSPGMIDWPVAEGQPQIFELLNNEQAKYPDFQVRLNQNDVMLPRKSVSFVIGFGVQVNKQGRTCDICAMKETCRYQEHYA